MEKDVWKQRKGDERSEIKEKEEEEEGKEELTRF